MSDSRGTRIYRRLGVDSPTFDPDHRFVTSPLLSPLALALVRLTLATYALVVVVYQIIQDAVKFNAVDGYFSYFTHLSYIGLIAYMYAAGVQGVFYVVNQRKGYPLQRWPRPLQFLHFLLYTTVTTYPIVVTVIFWALLSDPDTLSTTYSAWINISEHAMNTLFALLEIALTCIGYSPPWHLALCLFMLACYLGVAYITYAAQGFYTYSFLNPEKVHEAIAGYVIGIALAECVAYLLALLLTWVRMKVLKRASRGQRASLDVDNPVEDKNSTHISTTAVV